jgi:hypothetical protein
LTVDKVPPGKLRVVTLQWLGADGQPLEGLYYKAQGTLDDEHQTLEFNNETTAEGEVLLNMIKKHPDDAAKLISSDISYWIQAVITTAKVPNARFLDIDAVTEAMVGLSTKHIPPAKPEWGKRPGWVSIPFTNIQPGLRLVASVNDPVSGLAESLDGETLVLGPIPARDTPYKLTVRAIPSGDEAIGADLTYAPVDVVVKANETTLAPTLSLARGATGQPLPDRVGRASVAVVGSGDAAQLWLLNGVKYHDGDATGVAAFDVGAATVSGKSYRYTRGGGWTERGSLPAFFPLYGAATASYNNQIFCFGGYNSAGDRLRDVYTVDAASGQLTGNATQLPDADNEPKLAIANGVAATLGDRIYVTAGEAHEAGTDDQGNPTDNGLAATLVFDPATKTFDPQTLPGPAHPYKSMASAVVDGKWYTFGGFFATNTPVGDTQIFDPGAKAWSTGKAMPTPRYGAATAVLDGKIWVIGGETLAGAPCRAVEVYDPAADAWTRRAPLRWPCSYAAAIGLGGKIEVAGGISGVSDTGFGLPLRSTQTEELTP